MVSTFPCSIYQKASVESLPAFSPQSAACAQEQAPEKASNSAHLALEPEQQANQAHRALHCPAGLMQAKAQMCLAWALQLPPQVTNSQSCPLERFVALPTAPATWATLAQCLCLCTGLPAPIPWSPGKLSPICLPVRRAQQIIAVRAASGCQPSKLAYRHSSSTASLL